MMNKLLIAALLAGTPATVFAQTAAPNAPAEEPRSKVITVVRPDVAPAQGTASHTIGTVRARSARVGERTVNLVEGSLPEHGAPVEGSGG